MRQTEKWNLAFRHFKLPEALCTGYWESGPVCPALWVPCGLGLELGCGGSRHEGRG